MDKVANPFGTSACNRKIRYKSEQDASKVAIKRMLIDGIPLYTYECHLCFCWHITKMPPKQSREIAGNTGSKEPIDNLVGVKFGRFTVLRKASVAPARYEVKCECGNVELRSSKAIINKNNALDCCTKCREFVYSVRSGIYYRTNVRIAEQAAYDIAFCGQDIVATGRVVNNKPVIAIRNA